jgi:predicted DNA-binding transcriptional regulator AlpA
MARDDVTFALAEGSRLQSLAEVCDRVGRTRQCIWNWVKQGRFPPPRDVNNSPMWTQETIDHWIEALPIRRYPR